MASRSPPDTTTSPLTIVSSPAECWPMGPDRGATCRHGERRCQQRQRQPVQQHHARQPHRLDVLDFLLLSIGLSQGPILPCVARRLFHQLRPVAQPITPTMENNEYQIWLNKTASAGIAVGPVVLANKSAPMRGSSFPEEPLFCRWSVWDERALDEENVVKRRNLPCHGGNRIAGKRNG